ncbi:hypothetical protein [Aquabacterium sp.]|uniref:hypothetical protein n=2 Tax=Aquabacterium TaxID=92793 RepID=UPI0035C717E9
MMWKMLVGFVVFAAIVVLVLSKTDANIDMGGEKHGIDATHTEEPASAASAPASEAAPAASAASN